MKNVLVARILKPWGLKGELKIEFFNKENLKFAKSLNGKTILIEKDKIEKEFTVENISKKGFFTIKLRGFDTPEDAKELSNSKIYLDRENLESLDKDEYYYCDLENLNVYFKGEKIGFILSVVDCNDTLLEIEKQNKSKAMVPFNKKYIGDIDLNQKSIQIIDDSILDL